MEETANSISNILRKMLETRKPVTNIDLSVEDLFDGETVSNWIRRLLDRDGLSALESRLSSASPERLTHAASTYLLGLAVRENLGLNFDVLPRIFSHGAIGDAFHFFWSAICLCHDLGYHYEQECCDLSRMDSSAGRCALLKIHRDMFQLDADSLALLGIQPGDEMDWVLSTLELAKNYDRLRRRCGEKDLDGGVVDHGIAGALILYDILMDVYERFRPEESASHRRDPFELSDIHEGELPAHVGHKRFAACVVIIACTVARHNMWTAGASDAPRYQRYGLSALCERGSAVQIRGDDIMEQLLFLLCFMDTIDPVKGIYVRKAESPSPDPAVLDRHRAALLNNVSICFLVASRYRWSTSLKYRALTISISHDAPEDVRETFSRYAAGMAGMAGWLATRTPVYTCDKVGRIISVTCYYPTFPRREHVWAGGIQEHEVTALCLYAGGGVGKAGFFYQCRNAYQTFNLLMMEGFAGENVRIRQERQRPYGCYILEWQHTLEIMMDILQAQYKFMEYDQGTAPGAYTLHRVDRQVNFDMMCRRKETFAFTSTSKAGFLQELARPKKELVLLNVILTRPVPFVDYGRLLGRAYVYADEQEVLLPPFLEVLRVSEESLAYTDQMRFPTHGMEGLKKYTVEFGTFSPGEVVADETALIEWLDENKQTAAAVLEQLCEGHPPSADEKAVYLGWKERFQQLTRSCFGNTQRAFLLSEKVI